MLVALREFNKNGGSCSIFLELGPPNIRMGGTPNVGALEMTPFEKSQLEGWDYTKSPDETITLFAEIVRRRVQNGWKLSREYQDRRTFRRVVSGVAEHWSIEFGRLHANSVELTFGPIDEINRPKEPWIDPRRRQTREFRQRPAVMRRWYAQAVAARLAEGYVEIAPTPGKYAELGADPAILGEDVDPGELIRDSRAEPDSPEVRFMELHWRPCWVPVTVDGDGPVRGSKFSGLPWLANENDWPSCRKCGRPMLLFLQLDLASLPFEFDREPGDDLFQFFACREHAAYFDFGDGSHSETNLRWLVRPTGKNRAKVPKGLEPHPARRIVGWVRHDDYPGQADRFRIERARNRGNTNRYLCRVVTSEGLHHQFSTHQGDKLGGWPYWINQDEGLGKCPRCKRPLELLFQLDAGGNLPEIWGDNGIAHLTRCPEHKDVLHFDTGCS